MKFCPTCKSKFPTDINYCPNDATKLVNDPEAGSSHSLIGMILDNRYRIISKLGEGGMGSVYAAEHILLKKGVAIKVLRYDLARKDDVVRRFQNEAIAASRIGHENIIEVTDFGKTPDGSVYFVMEHLNGAALADIIQKSGSIPQKRAIPILLQITRALSIAHSQGIIHRDLKPENIVLIDKPDRKDFVKILDFGISKVLDTSDRAEKLTAMGMIVGTPEYMSPEQAAGISVDKRTDIYSLGVIMYEMLTGRLPFLADNAIRILMMHQTEKPTKPRDINPEIHLSFEQIILKCMEKRPEDRFQDMSEITQALTQIFSTAARAAEPRKTISFSVQRVPGSYEQTPQIVADESGERSSTPSSATIQYNPVEVTAIPVRSTSQEIIPPKIILTEPNNNENNEIDANRTISQISEPVTAKKPLYEIAQEDTTGSMQVAEEPQATQSVTEDLTFRKAYTAIPPIKEEEDQPSRGKKGKVTLIAAIAVILLVAIGTTFFLISGKKRHSEATTAIPGTNIPPPQVVNTEEIKPESEEAKKEEIAEVKTKEDSQEKRSTKVARHTESALLDISSIPENVEIYKGDSLMGVTPYQIKGRLNSSAEYIFKKPGYEPLKKRLVFDGSKKIQINLKKITETKKVDPRKEKDTFEKIDDLKDLKF